MKKNIYEWIPTALIIITIVFSAIITNNRFTVLSDELKTAHKQRDELEDTVKVINEELTNMLTEKKVLESDAVKTNAELNMALTEIEELNIKIEAFEESLISPSWLQFSHDNLFMGEWKVRSVVWRNRPVSDETAREMLDEHIGYPLIIKDYGLTYLGIEYNRFLYETHFFQWDGTYFTGDVPFKINGEDSGYAYYAELYGYTNGEKKYIGDIIMEDDNTARLRLITPGDSTVCLGMERQQ